MSGIFVVEIPNCWFRPIIAQRRANHHDFFVCGKPISPNKIRKAALNTIILSDGLKALWAVREEALDETDIWNPNYSPEYPVNLSLTVAEVRQLIRLRRELANTI